MKTLKVLLTVFVIACLTCSMASGHTFKKEVTVTMNGLYFSPELGTVSGYFTYLFTFKLNDEGYLESMHWNVGECQLFNDMGDKLKMIDSGHDIVGVIWDIFNRPDYYNGYISEIKYNVDDGWLDGIMPETMPVEGTMVNLSIKLLCKGAKYPLAGMMQLHMNANGDFTAYVVKGWLE